MDRHRHGLNSPALTIQRFNESLGEAIPVTQCSDRSVRTWQRTMRLRRQRTDHGRRVGGLSERSSDQKRFREEMH
jgi:hypothetical protein